MTKQDKIQKVLHALERVSKVGDDQYSARCPAHEDRNPSLSLKVEQDKILVHCHAGCDPETILSAAGLRWSDLDLRGATDDADEAKGRIVATYDYTTATGELIYQVIRYEPKSFRQRKPGAKPGTWTWSTKGVQRVLYRLPKIAQAVAEGKPIIWVEGEKDVHTLESLGFVSTTTAGGAKQKIDRDVVAPLADATVVIIPDADEPGMQYANAVQRALRSVGAHATIAQLPETHNGTPVKDVSDWVAAGATGADVNTLIQDAISRLSSANPDDVLATAKSDIFAIRTGDDDLSTKYDAIASVITDAMGKLGILGVDADDQTAMYYVLNHEHILRRVNQDDITAMRVWADMWGYAPSDTGWSQIHDRVMRSAMRNPIRPARCWHVVGNNYKPSAVYISCGPDEMVRITDSGIDVLPNGTDEIYFASEAVCQKWQYISDTSQQLSPRALRAMQISAQDDSDTALLLAAASLVVHNIDSKPPIMLYGVPGSGKTLTARAIAELWGLPSQPMAIKYQDENEFWMMLNRGGVCVFDNADSSIPWLPDSIASATTGGEVKRRKLYTNDVLISFRPRAWMLLTSVSPAYLRDAAVTDRMIMVCVQRRTLNISDDVLLAEVREKRDAVLSWIATVWHHMLRMLAWPIYPEAVRHPAWYEAALAFGQIAGLDMLKALQAMSSKRKEAAIDQSPIIQEIIEHVDQHGSVEGTPAKIAELVSNRLHQTVSSVAVGRILASGPIPDGYLLQSSYKHGHQRVYHITRKTA